MWTGPHCSVRALQEEVLAGLPFHHKTLHFLKNFFQLFFWLIIKNMIKT